ncbi:hypothetical protein [Vacuolonema iberomarrocanum]|uniref:hypothetical protein n=1 Tax=Vacuolonema iberomarrocanum TaxID=3454632 RepID=UPI0019F8DE6F|nr:hypothetical protein [filamentous cyanobacterium LEGE 07170]
MADLVQQFRQWLIKKRFFRVAWFAKDPQLSPEPDEALSQLPSELADKLIELANQLPVNPREEAVVLQSLKDAIARWKDLPRETPNSIVILSDPISSAARILTSGLYQIEADKNQLLPIKLLDWVQRPADPSVIKQQVQEQLGIAKSDTFEEDNCEQTLMVIPNLCWCFLRSAEGLDGLDYLQDLLPRNHSRFWILGSSIVGWEYLKCTLQFHAYCGDIITLPALSGEDLQSWLSPIVEQFNICFSDAALHKRLQNSDSSANLDMAIDRPIEALSEMSQEVSATVQSSVRAVKDRLIPEASDDSENSSKLDYFNRLATISDGVSVVALQLFVKSLRYQEMSVDESSGHSTSSLADHDGSEENCVSSESVEKSDVKTSSNKQQYRLVATIPKRPPLPELSQSDLYLLYSLLLHSDLTISELAESLGDTPQIINHQVQILRNVGVIEQQGQVIKTNPMHYPELYRELARNNFIIEVPRGSSR